MNILNKYIDFKKNNLYKYTKILLDDYFDEEIESFIYKFIDTYIQTYFFHSLQTLDRENIEIYNVHVITQELIGKKIEINYELDMSNQTNKKSKVTLAHLSTLTAITLDTINLVSINEDIINKTIKSIANKLKVEDTSGLVNRIIKELKSFKNKEIKFLDNLFFKDFSIRYLPYRNQIDKYHVELCHNIQVLGDRYPKVSIDKNFNKIELAEKKLETTLILLNIDILLKLKESYNLEYYFVYVPGELLDNKKRILELFDIIDNEYIRDKIIFLINYNDYMNHKRVLNVADEKYSFAALVDMSHIREIENKLDTIASVSIFDYIITDKVKSKDYESIIKYETISGKEVFVNELEKE